MVIYNDAIGVRSTGWIQIVPVAPGLISADGSGKGVAAAFAIETGPGNVQPPSLIFKCVSSPLSCQPIPVNAGSTSNPTYLELFGTGIRHVKSIDHVSCTIGGIPSTVTYAGAQGAFTGLDQVNVLVPPSLAGRLEPLDVLLTVDGQIANPVTVQFAAPR